MSLHYFLYYFHFELTEITKNISKKSNGLANNAIHCDWILRMDWVQEGFVLKVYKNKLGWLCYTEQYSDRRSKYMEHEENVCATLLKLKYGCSVWNIVAEQHKSCMGKSIEDNIKGTWSVRSLVCFVSLGNISIFILVVWWSSETWSINFSIQIYL